jgi:CRISP-associated protein Cas1
LFVNKLTTLKSLLFLPTNGTALQVRKGSLCVRTADSVEALYPARIHGYRTIILAGRGGSITDEAIRWAARENVALWIMCRAGECHAVIAEAPGMDNRRQPLAIRQRQFAAVLNTRKRLDIARKIVVAKLRTLALHPADARAFREEIAGARTILDLMAAEARAGGIYYMQWLGAEIRFKDACPDHWRVFVTRQAPPLKGLIGTSLARNAATPIGAALNYCFSVALGQCTRAVIGTGMDPSFGFLHVPRQGRLSLSYDVLEFHRADLTEAVFDHVAKTSFVRGDFEQSQTGVVSLCPAVARDIAALALRVVTITATGKSVARLISWM